MFLEKILTKEAYEMIAERGLENLSIFDEWLVYDYARMLLEQTDKTPDDIKMISNIVGIETKQLNKFLYICNTKIKHPVADYLRSDSVVTPTTVKNTTIDRWL